MSKPCGSCRYFVKCKNDMLSGGLCEKRDQRTNTDSRGNCKKFKRKFSPKVETDLRKLYLDLTWNDILENGL